MPQKASLTIGIAAYNEELNIGNLLQSILIQQFKDAEITEILIYSDGSTDNTVKIARSYKNKKIRIIESIKRLGQWYRMNQIMQAAKGDIIIFLDADVVLATKNTLQYLIEGFKTNKKVGIVSGSPTPQTAKTFTEKAVSVTWQAYEELKESIRGGNNVFAVSGNILSLRTVIARGIKIPSSVYATDAFLYFSCLKKGYTFLYMKKAKVWNRVPSTLHDQIKQSTRFNASPYHLKQFFGNVVDEEYLLPVLGYLKVVSKQFIRHPILSSYIFAVNLYCKYLAKKQSLSISSVWSVSRTTKEGISYEK